MARRTRFRSALRFSTLILLTLVVASYSHPQEVPSVTLPDDEIHALANRVLQKTEQANCKPRNCRILVANFTLPSGATSQLGMQLADAFAMELASQQNAIQIIERSRLQTYLEQERIPATQLNNEKAIRWLGMRLGATAVLTGTTEDQGASVHVQVSLLSCDTQEAGPVEGFSFPDSDSRTGLTPVDSFPKTSSSSDQSSIPLVLRAGVDGVTSPSCLYCPNPDYTNPAREAKYNGTVLLDATVSAEGRAIGARVVRGVPFGLNEAAIKAVHDWQFKPATREGEPVTCTVMIEVTYSIK